MVQILISVAFLLLSVAKLLPAYFKFLSNPEVGCTIYFVILHYLLAVHLLLLPVLSIERLIAVAKPFSRVGDRSLTTSFKVGN